MSTTYDSGYTVSELQNMNAIASLGALDDQSLAMLYMQGMRIIRSDHPEVSLWLKEIVDTERRVRASNGVLERSLPCVPYRWSIHAVLHLCLACHFLRDLESLSEPARAWYRELHQTCMTIVAARARVASANDKLLLPREVCDVLGVSRDQLMRLVKLGRIPQPLKISPRSYRWHPKDVLVALSNM